MAIFEYGEYQNTYESPDNLVEIFENSVSKYANNLFIGEKDSSGVYQWVTYAQIAARVDNLRGGLASLGVQAGDTVGIIANNRKEWEEIRNFFFTPVMRSLWAACSFCKPYFIFTPVHSVFSWKAISISSCRVRVLFSTCCS